MRDRIAMVAALVLLLAAAPRPVFAGDAGKIALATLGLPELAIRVTDDRIEAPAQIPAGRTRISIANDGTNEAQLLMGQLPPGKTVADWLAAENADVLPDWLFQVLYVGIPGYL